MSDTTPNDQICGLCGQTEGFHFQRADDPSHPNHLRCFIDPKRPQLHPTNRFTPRREEQHEVEKCSGCGGPIEPWSRLNRCIKCGNALAACPPGSLPFNLQAALAGHRAVTRDGQEAKDFEKYSAHARFFTCRIGRLRLCFNEDGTCRLEDACHPRSLDLFLAAPLDGESSPTESETKRQEVYDHEDLDAICSNCNRRKRIHSFALRCPLPDGSPYNKTTGPFSITHSFSAPPATPKPRRVFCVWQTDGEPAHFQEFNCKPLPAGWTQSEFIELSTLSRMSPEERERFFREEGK